MGDLIPLQVFLIKQIHKEAEQELKRHYQQTAGFQDPDIPSSELIERFQQGEIEL
jgi:hypothetical protein